MQTYLMFVKPLAILECPRLFLIDWPAGCMGYLDMNKLRLTHLNNLIVRRLFSYIDCFNFAQQ